MRKYFFFPWCQDGMNIGDDVIDNFQEYWGPRLLDICAVLLIPHEYS